MGKKEDQRRFDQQMALLRQQIDRANQPSAYETAWLNQFNANKSFLDSKDYRNLPTGVNIDMLGLADTNRMRQMMIGRDSGDQAAAGADGRIQQTQKQLLNDQAQRDWSGAYEQKIGGLMDQQMGLSQAGQQSHSQRMGQGIQGMSNFVQLLGQRPKDTGGFWGNLFKGLIPGAASGLAGLI